MLKRCQVLAQNSLKLNASPSPLRLSRECQIELSSPETGPPSPRPSIARALALIDQIMVCLVEVCAVCGGELRFLSFSERDSEEAQPRSVERCERCGRIRKLEEKRVFEVRG